ncbi:MAG TPA: hypothetical protein VL172_12380, partial [Kofleriaceae bacterium]|nr:hypothetical protein [Kofleriaceae bacterium]
AATDALVGSLARDADPCPDDADAALDRLLDRPRRPRTLSGLLEITGLFRRPAPPPRPAARPRPVVIDDFADTTEVERLPPAFET